MTISQTAVSSARVALAIARAEARFARGRGNTYSAAFNLDCGRTLLIVPAPPVNGRPRADAWVYFYQEEGARVRPLAL
jgi:hypothetical protein